MTTISTTLRGGYNVGMAVTPENAIVRILTLKAFEDFIDMPKNDKLRVIAKVAVIGLLTLGVATAAFFIHYIAIWSIPMSALATMALTFSLSTTPQHDYGK